jgi:hypothetical protein
MSAAAQDQFERYLLPIMPALWLLSVQAIATVFRHSRWLAVGGLLCIVLLTLSALIRQNYEWTNPDTRILAKEWIEAHIPSGKKILMDGTQYRFSASPPLSLNHTAVTHRIARTRQAERVSRGVSEKSLALYAAAMADVKGPTYELYSTMHGLVVEDLTYYIQACFDYIITSSFIAEKYANETNQSRFPKSAQFYKQLQTDPRVQVVYSVAPTPWGNSGPTITMYKIPLQCQSAAPSLDQVKH